jgi:hypothetical protein
VSGDTAVVIFFFERLNLCSPCNFS